MIQVNFGILLLSFTFFILLTVDTNYTEEESKKLFESIHDISKLKTKLTLGCDNNTKSHEFYNYSILKADLNKLNLGNFLQSRFKQ